VGGAQLSHGTILAIRADPGDAISARSRPAIIQPRLGYVLDGLPANRAQR
jgi:hypothetical protein